MNQSQNFTSYPTMQWSGGQQYPTSSSGYSSTPYHHSSHVGGVPHQPGYGADTHQGEAPYHGDYYQTPSNYSHSSSPPAAQHYPAGHSMRPAQSPQRPSHSHSHSQSHLHGQSPYSQAHPPPQSYSQSRPRSHSQAPSYVRTQTAPMMIPQQAPSHYPSSPQGMSISPQYPATPLRPFCCDLCALSFNRQHDLKRHRETHTGEKPYLCNGGCGKTFTRKDALKRHQLVKGCGKPDDAWP